VRLSKKLKKVPIVVKNCPGFLVNRILMPYVNEAVYLLQDGVDIERIDRVAKAFGMPMGPLSLADEVGLDVGFKVAKTLEDSYESRMIVPDLMKQIVEAKGWSGKKSDRGFYIYNKKEKSVNSEVYKLLNESDRHRDPITDGDIRDRLIFTIINEASRCLDEDIVKNASYLDMAMILGTGFPAFRGGVCRYADSVGIPKIVEKLRVYASSFGDRFLPSQPLEKLERDNKNFYGK
jgi:3-hydroxyacyl-CoA dehydrogenase / enoyl-CoA hydratase / 3-hydroxybutyryl-CoA epimerase